MTRFHDRLHNIATTIVFNCIVALFMPFVLSNELLSLIRDRIGCTLPRGSDSYLSHDHRFTFWTWSASH